MLYVILKLFMTISHGPRRTLDPSHQLMPARMITPLALRGVIPAHRDACSAGQSVMYFLVCSARNSRYSALCRTSHASALHRQRAGERPSAVVGVVRAGGTHQSGRVGWLLVVKVVIRPLHRMRHLRWVALQNSTALVRGGCRTQGERAHSRPSADMGTDQLGRVESVHVDVLTHLQ